MAKTTVYVVNGTTVENIKAVSELLGAKVTKKAILAGEVEGVTARTIDIPLEDMDMDTDADNHEEPTLFDDSKEEAAPTLEDTTEEPTDTEEDTKEEPTDEEDSTDEDTDTDEDSTGEDNELTNANRKLGAPVAVAKVNANPVLTDVEYPELGHFEDEKAMKKYTKKLTDAQLQEWCELEGVEWKYNEHQAINRMRMAMAIKGLHFPSTAPKGKSKKKGKYSDYRTEDLVQMALDNDIEVKDDKGNERILRMYTIMALREAGLIS